MQGCCLTQGKYTLWPRDSAGEVEAQLYVTIDQGYITPEQFETLHQLTASTKKLIAGFINYLKKSELRGQKYKP